MLLFVFQTLDKTSIDEDLLSDYVSFVQEENLFKVAAAFLLSPAARWHVERKSLSFIMANQFKTDSIFTNCADHAGNDDGEIEQLPTSLTLLANALSQLAGIVPNIKQGHVAVST